MLVMVDLLLVLRDELLLVRAMGPCGARFEDGKLSSKTQIDLGSVSSWSGLEAPSRELTIGGMSHDWFIATRRPQSTVV